MNYYIAVGGEQKGPFTRQQLSRMWDSGAVTADTLYSADGMTEWKQLRGLAEASDKATGHAAQPPPLPPQASIPPPLAAPHGRASESIWKRRGSFISRIGQSPRFRAWSSMKLNQRLLIGGTAALFVVVMIVACLVIVVMVDEASSRRIASATTQEASYSRSPTPLLQDLYPDEVQQWLLSGFNGELAEKRQAIFDALHPTGTADRVKVTDATVHWKPGSRRWGWNDIEKYTVQFILYWHGPLTTDGYTEVEWTYDAILERFTAYRVVRSNGITKDDLADALGQLAQEAVKSWADRSR